MPMSVLKALVASSPSSSPSACAARRGHLVVRLVLGALTAGALIGVLLVGRIRRLLSEQQMLAAALWLVAASPLSAPSSRAGASRRWWPWPSGRPGAVAKPSFDALVQRHVRESNQGRAFARFETRLQLMWVVGSLVPVVLSLPLAAGYLVMAVVAALAASPT